MEKEARHCKSEAMTCVFMQLKLYQHRQPNLHPVHIHGTVHGQDSDPIRRRLPQGTPELRVGLVVGTDVLHIGHLDHKEDVRPVPLPRQRRQPPDVLRTPLRGGIGEGADPVIFQSAIRRYVVCSSKPEMTSMT